MPAAAAQRLLFACLTGFAVAAPAAEIAVDVTRSGDTLHVQASAEIEGSVARTWQVLTDYDRLAEIIPDLRVSRVISRQGNLVQLEQKGETRLLFFSFPLDVRLAITEHPRERIVSRAVSGNFRDMRGAYTLEGREGRVLLRYTGSMIPDFYVPPLIGTWALRHSVQTSFQALVDEIERSQSEPAPAAVNRER
jgi:hypothetical protein